MAKNKGAPAPPGIRLQSVTGPQSLASFAAAEATFDDGWVLETLESYPGHLVLGADDRVPAGAKPAWAGSAAYRTLADVGWVIVDLVRGEAPHFYELLGRRLLGVRKVKRVGLLLPEGHPGVPPLAALGFSEVAHETACERVVVQPHLLPAAGEVRLVWNAAFGRG